MADTSLVSEKPPANFRLPSSPVVVQISVGGMTCASCVRALTEAISEHEGIVNVSVNLLGKSASVTVAHDGLVDTVLTAIGDAGFDGEVISVTPILGPNHPVDGALTSRMVELKVTGMPDKQCIDAIMAALDNLSSKLTIIKSLQKTPDDTLRLAYIPVAPDFTIRSVLTAIVEASPPAVTATLARPPSFEDAALRMHRREQRMLSLRLAVAILSAIPTLIIGIIYMSLVPKGNSVRRYFEKAIWAGQVSRGEWALLCLATPVMFYAAEDFHRRALKELWMLWRPGSRASLSSRFLRFGSMNLLISLGVSVAYFSSVAELAISARKPQMNMKGHDMSTTSMTYFDSVVFLTLFLLIGRFIEAFSKRHAASAVNSLTKLQSSEALLVTGTSNILSRTSSSSGIADLKVPATVKQSPVESGWEIKKIHSDLLEVGDVVRVPPGGTPPADGTVISTQGTYFDESSLTGESRNISKGFGDQVYVGTINKLRAIDIKVDAIGGETMLDKIIDVVRQGQTKRAPIERLADVITSHFVPVVTALAIITWIVWMSLGLSGSLPLSEIENTVGGWPAWSLEFAIAVFIIACPCGIGLAAPTALLVGSGLAAKYGILVRGGGEAFQDASNIDIMVFDKTGTLTEGSQPKVTNAVLSSGFERLQLPRGVLDMITLYLASASSHPLCIALRDYLQGETASQLTINVSDIEELPGRGMMGTFRLTGTSEGDIVLNAIMGSEAFLRENNAIPSTPDSATLHHLKSEGKSVVLLALQKRPSADVCMSSSTNDDYFAAGFYAVADPIRPEARSVISQLHEQGIETWMISGDNAITAVAVANSVGIPEENVIAGVLPQQKAEKVQWLQNSSVLSSQNTTKAKRKPVKGCRRVVAMVGDGINDAPALTAADVGIAIGSGSDVALSSAKFVLLSSNLCSLLTLTDLSAKVFRRIKFNFMWAGIYNIIALPLAAGVIYPAGQARLNPVWSSLAMALSSTSVVCSSLLLRFYTPPSASPERSHPVEFEKVRGFENAEVSV